VVQNIKRKKQGIKMKFLKYIFISIFSVLLFAGCSNTKVKTPINPMEKFSKQELIKKANRGNIKAMIELNRVYLFPQTKEGLDLYNSWFSLVLKAKDSQDVFTFANIFKEYKDMFINGDIKYAQILEQASKLGNSEATYTLHKFYYYTLQDKPKREKLEDTLYNNPNAKNIAILYRIYTDYLYSDRKNELEKIIREKGIVLTPKQNIYRLKHFYFQKGDKEKRQKIQNTILNSKDTEALKVTSKFFIKNRKYQEAIVFLEKAIKIDPNDSSTYMLLAQVYRNTYQKEQRLSTLKKAALLDNYTATKELLNTYKKDLVYAEDYSSLVIEISKLNEAKRALSDFYFENKRRVKADELLKELIAKGNTKAIVRLASRSKVFYKNPTSEHLNEIKKWQDYILNSDKPYLVSQLRDAFKRYSLFADHKKIRNALKQKEIDQNNIMTLRKVYQNTYRNKKLKKTYKDKLIAFGDVKTIMEVASRHLYKKRYEKGFALYEGLSHKGHYKASIRMAKFYDTYKKEQKDLKKALKYYERAYNQGDYTSLEKVTFYYLCGECMGDKNSKLINLQKAEPYISKVLDSKDFLNIYKVASVFQRGLYVKKDLKRAIKYFKYLVYLKYYTAYFHLSQIYKYEYNDAKTSLMYAKKGAALKNPTCITQLAYFYQEGYGVKKDMAKAIELYKEVAKDQPFASYTVGMYYFTRKDYPQAREYLEMGIQEEGWEGATEQRAKVQLELGIIYEKGLGVDANMKKALKFYEDSYNYLLQDPNSTERKMSAYNIAQIYHHGKGSISKNLKKAKEWYKKSNTPQAQNELKKLGE
jgi:TPR repeat protein